MTIQIFNDEYFVCNEMEVPLSFPEMKPIVPLKKKYQEFIEKETISEEEALQDSEYCNVIHKKHKVLLDIIHPDHMDTYETEMRQELRHNTNIRFV
jgi:hypothetical protein